MKNILLKKEYSSLTYQVNDAFQTFTVKLRDENNNQYNQNEVCFIKFTKLNTQQCDDDFLIFPLFAINENQYKDVNTFYADFILNTPIIVDLTQEFSLEVKLIMFFKDFFDFHSSFITSADDTPKYLDFINNNKIMSYIIKDAYITTDYFSVFSNYYVILYDLKEKVFDTSYTDFIISQEQGYFDISKALSLSYALEYDCECDDQDIPSDTYSKNDNTKYYKKGFDYFYYHYIFAQILEKSANDKSNKDYSLEIINQFEVCLNNILYVDEITILFLLVTFFKLLVEKLDKNEISSDDFNYKFFEKLFYDSIDDLVKKDFDKDVIQDVIKSKLKYYKEVQLIYDLFCLFSNKNSNFMSDFKKRFFNMDCFYDNDFKEYLFSHIELIIFEILQKLKIVQLIQDDYVDEVDDENDMYELFKKKPNKSNNNKDFFNIFDEQTDYTDEQFFNDIDDILGSED